MGWIIGLQAVVIFQIQSVVGPISVPSLRGVGALATADSQAGLRPTIQFPGCLNNEGMERKLILFDFYNSNERSAQVNLVHDPI